MLTRYRKAFAAAGGSIILTVQQLTSAHPSAVALASAWVATALVFLFPNDPPVPSAPQQPA